MYALLSNTDQLVDGKPVEIYRKSKAIEVNGLSLPSNWMQLLSKEEKQALHIWPLTTVTYDKDTNKATGAENTYTFDTIVYETIPNEYDQDTVDKSKAGKLESDLTAVDVSVAEARAENFEYDGHMYYPDADSLNALITTMPYKPEDFTMNWKTADLEADGISNIYVLLDKTGIIELGMALELRQGTAWATGDAQKIALKEEYRLALS